jgi:hypothetical protein
MQIERLWVVTGDQSLEILARDAVCCHLPLPCSLPTPPRVFKTPAKIHFLSALATSKTQMLIHARSYQLGDASVHFVDTTTWTM